MIEDSCKYIVRDRFDLTGGRWSLDGAEAVLKLRAVRANGDWSSYWGYHLAEERKRIHESRFARGIISHAADQSLSGSHTRCILWTLEETIVYVVIGYGSCKLGEWSRNAMALLEELREAVIDGQAKLALAKVTEGLDGGVEAGTLLREGLIAAMARVGQLYEEGEIFVPEMLVAARAMTAALTVLKPHLVEEGVASGGTVAIGTTQGDLHDIGKNLVAMMLEGSGYEIVDLGVDVPAEKFIEAIRNGANVVAMSALLTTTMTNMQVAIEAIREAGLRDQVRIIIGGAPITKSYADEIGADGYAEDASSAVRLVKEVLAA